MMLEAPKKVVLSLANIGLHQKHRAPPKNSQLRGAPAHANVRTRYSFQLQGTLQ